MYYLRLLTFLVVLNCISSYSCLKYTIKENFNIPVDPFKTRINKRGTSQFFDRAAFSFNGLEKVESVPVIFPLDICIFMVNQIRHVASLHINGDGNRSFVIFRATKGAYEELLSLQTPLAVGMDCRSFDQKGFVALAYNITSSVEQANKGTPIFQIDSERIKAVQYFGSPNLRSVYLRTTEHDLFLLQSFETSTNSSARLFCPYFKWSGSSFDKLGRIPCSNARRLEPFAMESESYVAVANYADKFGQTETHSEIYKYDREQKKLILFQKIKTNAAVDVKYFSVPFDEVKEQHFLIFGNSRSANKDQKEAESVIYTYDKGTFIAYQALPLYDVREFLPVENVDSEKFILLVACSNQETQIYNLNDWKFEKSMTQFTEGAFGKGVSKMRIFKEDDHSFLVIANERMMSNETNVFLPIFTQEVHANTKRQEIIEWARTTIERLSKIDVEKIKNDLADLVRLKMAQESHQREEILAADIDTVYTRSLISRKFNLTKSYWEDLALASQAVDALQARLNKKPSSKRHAEEAPEYTYENLNVGTLVVRNKLNAAKINGVDPNNIEFEKVSAPKVVVSGDFQRPPEARNDADGALEFPETVTVENLKISGDINGINWEDLQTNALKKSGLQFIKAPVEIETLTSDSFVSSSNVINGENLSRLVRIDGGDYVINQDVKFSKPVYMKQLTIHDRLNNIHVHRNKLDVLLLNSDEVQYITGRKTFENVKLLEPVTISGKILGELDAMAPFKPIHQSLSLKGDYTITGDVTIEELLSAYDIKASPYGNGLKRVLDEGLSAHGPFDGLKLKFDKPIEANNSIVTLVNGHDLSQLVRTNTDEVQIIEGHKIFEGDLEISKGFAEVQMLNGIDVDQLESNILMDNIPQNITGNMQFRKVIVNRIVSPSIEFQGSDLSNYLTKSGEQECTGSLTVGNFTSRLTTVGNVQTDMKIFGIPAHSLGQREISNPSPEIFKAFEGTIYADDLKIGGHINDVPIEEIERLLTQLDGKVKYVGNLKFNEMMVSNLTFTGTFNGIPAEEFGNCWLTQGTDQVFTAPQTFLSISSPGIKISGTLNGHTFEEYVSGTYKIDRDEHIPNAVFEGTVKVGSAVTAATVNGLRIPADILLRNSDEPQVLTEDLIVLSDVYVKGRIQNVYTVNNISLVRLKDYLDSDTDTITVEHATFENAPSFITINSHNLRETLESVWLANEDVDLQHHVEITDGYFLGPLDFQGPINGMNLNYLKENYFSLSKPQHVSAEIIFSKKVVFKNDFESENMYLYGPIIVPSSGAELDFNDFAENALLKSGNQRITAQWKIYEGVVEGDLNNVLINGLNLANDVVRHDVALNVITAPKRVQTASIQDLYCEPGSTVNGVDLSEWILGAVFVYENYTIYGNTTIDSLIVLNDMHVHGTVNNMTFDENNILLRDTDQVIYGDVNIVTTLPDEGRILTSTFEELNAKTVNGLNIDEFFENQVIGDVASSPIDGMVSFENPVKVEHLESQNEVLKLEGDETDFTLLYNQTLTKCNELKQAIEDIEQSAQCESSYLSHFELKQTIHASAEKVISLTLRIDGSFVDVIGVIKEDNDSDVDYYRWDFYQQEFVVDKLEKSSTNFELSKDRAYLVFLVPCIDHIFLAYLNVVPIRMSVHLFDYFSVNVQSTKFS